MSQPDYNIDAPPAATTEDQPKVSVSLGDPGAFISEVNPQAASVYFAWGCRVTYKLWRSGLGWSPVAAPKGQGRLAFFRMHDEVWVKTAVWVAATLKDAPAVPHPQTGDNEVLDDMEFTDNISAPLPDGTPVNLRTGYYRWVLQKAPTFDDRLATGISPFSKSVVAERTLAVNDFAKYLIAPSPPPSGFSGGPITF